MFCKHCGKSIESDSVFCRYCGKPQNSSVVIEHQETRYETAEVDWFTSGGIFNRTYLFSVIALGVNGRYNVGNSVSFSKEDVFVGQQATGSQYTHIPKQTQQAINALNDLNKQVISAGWDPLPVGKFWFSYRYRKPFSS